MLILSLLLFPPEEEEDWELPEDGKRIGVDVCDSAGTFSTSRPPPLPPPPKIPEIPDGREELELEAPGNIPEDAAELTPPAPECFRALRSCFRKSITGE